LLELTGLSEYELDGALLGLANPKLKILKKEVNRPTIEGNEKFTLNTAFKSKMMISNVEPFYDKDKKNNDEKKKEQLALEQIVHERSYIMDAIIVRLMKSRNVMTHSDLIMDVKKQCMNFKPQPKHIKDRVEVLIEQDYMERDKKVRNQYIYKP